MTLKRLTPNLMVENVREALAFYRDVLGFVAVSEVPNPDAPDLLNFAILVNGDVQLMLQARASFEHDVPGTHGVPVGASQTLYIDVDGLDALAEVVAGRADILKPLHTTWYNMKELYFRDPQGYLWCLAEAAAAP